MYYFKIKYIIHKYVEKYNYQLMNEKLYLYIYIYI